MDRLPDQMKDIERFIRRKIKRMGVETIVIIIVGMMVCVAFIVFWWGFAIPYIKQLLR